MAENNATAEGELKKEDIFYTQEKIMGQLIDVLKDRGAGTPQQVIYATAAEQAKSPNYLLYIGLAILAIILLRKK